jgi:hypothetical protein
MIVVECGDTRVCLEWIGEGLCGDYDETDPDDKPLLRFDVERLVEDAWEPVEDSSYCTQIERDAPVEVRLAAVNHILDRVAGTTGSIKRICEQLSWLHTSDFKTTETT